MFYRWPSLYQFEFLIWAAIACVAGYRSLAAQSTAWILVNVALAAYALLAAWRAGAWTVWYRTQVAAYRRFHRGDYQGAAELYARCTRLSPLGAPNHFDLCTALAHLGRYEEAAASVSRAIELDPTEAKHFRARAWLREQLGDHALAGQDLAAADRLEPGEGGSGRAT